MDYKFLSKNIFTSLIVISVLCVLAIYITELLSITTTLKEAVIAEIIGSGILGGIVSSVFFYLQELASFQSNVGKSKPVVSRLTLDIKEANDRGASYWNLSGGIKFYFDFSIINSLYDVYEKHYDSIEEFFPYIGDNKFLKLYSSIYLQTRAGYVLGEKIDNVLRQIVRAAHHKKGLIAANDPSTVAYLKAKLVTNIPDDGIIKHLEWNAVPERASELLSTVKANKEEMKNITEIIELRLKIMKEIEKLVQLAT